MPAHGRRHVAGVGDVADIEGRLLMPILSRAIHFYRPQRPDTALLPLSGTLTAVMLPCAEGTIALRISEGDPRTSLRPAS